MFICQIYVDYISFTSISTPTISTMDSTFLFMKNLDIINLYVIKITSVSLA